MYIILIDKQYASFKLLAAMLQLVVDDCLVINHVATPLDKLITDIASQCDVVVIASDAPSATLLEQISLMHLHQPKPMVLFTKSDNVEMIKSATRAGVSAYVAGNLPSERAKSVLQAAIARFEEMSFLKDALHDMQAKLTERKTIERAKGLLMKQRQMTEYDAYSMLRSMAMKKNMKLADLSSQLLETASMLIV